MDEVARTVFAGCAVALVLAIASLFQKVVRLVTICEGQQRDIEQLNQDIQRIEAMMQVHERAHPRIHEFDTLIDVMNRIESELAKKK